MLRLIKNEYIKLFKKGGFIALTIIFLASTTLLPLLGFILSKNSDTITKKLNNVVYDSLKTTSGSDKEYSNMIDFMKEEELNYYDLADWKIFAVNIAFSSTMHVDITDATEEEDFYSLFSTPSLNPIILDDAENLKDEICKEIKDNDINSFIDTYFNKIYPAYENLLTEYNQKYNIACSDMEVFRYAFEVIKDDNIDVEKDEWKLSVAHEYGFNRAEYERLQKFGFSDEVGENAQRKENMDILKYRLDNNIKEAITKNAMDKYESNNEFFANFMECSFLVTFAGLILFMVGIGIIAKEFNQGTIKFLLVNPVKRSSIFWSKVITLISLLVFSTLWVLISQFILNSLFYGGYPSDIAYIAVKNGNIKHYGVLSLILVHYGNAFVGALMLCIASIFLSAFIRNGAFAAGITLFVYLGGTIVGGLLNSKGFYIFEFGMFQNTDLLSIYHGHGSYAIQTIQFSVTVLIVHAIIFLWAARDSFVKKDI